MIDTGEIRKGSTLDIDGKLVKVTEYSHNKQARGSANIKMTLKDLRTGSNTTMTAMAGAKFTPVRLERSHVQFLYADEDHFNFMDTETFDQIMLDRKVLEDVELYMKENDIIDLLTYNDEPIDVELPTSVELTVTTTDPGFKGDTATGGNKPATLETGLVVNVPLFVNEGDKLKIDTRTGEYVERV